MLNKLDDFPIHQTPEPIAHPAASDRNVYDRTWYNGAFSVATRGGRQHCFFGSRRAPLERTEMQVGPFRMEVIEPMRRARVVLEKNKSGITCDLTFSTRTAPIQEARQVLWAGARRTMDATRFDQFGRWSGSIRHPDGEINVDERVCRARSEEHTSELQSPD